MFKTLKTDTSLSRKNKKNIEISGQSLIEYSLLIGVVVVVFFTMGPFIRRGIQGVIKTMADQIGEQRNGDQDATTGTRFLGSNLLVRTEMSRRTDEQNYAVNYIYDRESTDIRSVSQSQLGFTNTQN